jgi:hypothetical protein
MVSGPSHGCGGQRAEALAALKARGVKLGPKKANTAAAHEATRLRWARYRAQKGVDIGQVTA